MASVAAVRSWMSWFGWTSGGDPGSRKLNHREFEIGRHGDATWQADVERSIEAVDREREEGRLAEYRRFACSR